MYVVTWERWAYVRDGSDLLEHYREFETEEEARRFADMIVSQDPGRIGLSMKDAINVRVSEQ
jgi:hypothetical protein